MSASPPKADVVQHGPDVRFVPNCDICGAAKIYFIRVRPYGRRTASKRDELAPPHSIISSARADSVGGTSI
jgi:hypothetical protein